MNLGDMIEEFRIEADDNAEGQLFSDNEIRVWLNQGYYEAARRAHMLIDSDTTSICQVVVPAGTSTFTLDPSVILLKRVCIPAKQNKVIYAIKFETMDACRPNWQSATGEPKAYVIGLNARQMKLYPTPTEDTTLALTVIRTPLAKMEEPSDTPDALMSEEWHRSIIQWALHKAYSKHDVETQDLERAARHLRAFEDEFGTREEANAAREQMYMNILSYHFNAGVI